MRYFVTKYCLSSGVQMISGDEPDDNGVVMAIGYNCYHLGKDCFQNMEDARADAEKRRQAAIKSAKKRLAKLESMEF